MFSGATQKSRATEHDVWEILLGDSRNPVDNHIILGVPVSRDVIPWKFPWKFLDPINSIQFPFWSYPNENKATVSMSASCHTWVNSGKWSYFTRNLQPRLGWRSGPAHGALFQYLWYQKNIGCKNVGDPISLICLTQINVWYSDSVGSLLFWIIHNSRIKRTKGPANEAIQQATTGQRDMALVVDNSFKWQIWVCLKTWYSFKRYAALSSFYPQKLPWIGGRGLFDHQAPCLAKRFSILRITWHQWIT